MFTVNCIIL